MVEAKAVFSGFSVKEMAKAKQFYTEVLGLKVVDENMGLRLSLPGGGEVFLYEKEDHSPASFTILNFVVDDINKAVDDLVSSGVKFEHYEGMMQDDKDIARGIASNHGPDIAWFKDPSGNILSVLQPS